MDDANLPATDDHDQLRVSDTEREAVVAQLTGATADGRLTLAEFSERAGQVYASKTRGELAVHVRDLPGTGLPPSGDSASARRAGGHGEVSQVTKIGSVTRSGRWRLDQDTEIRTIVGSVKLDLSGAEIAAAEVELHIRSTVGSVKIWIPNGVRVVVDGATTVGSRQIEEDSAHGAGPLVRLRIDTTVGSVKVFRV